MAVVIRGESMAVEADFDFDELAAWEKDVGSDLAASMAGVFAQSGPASIASLRDALAARDSETAHREAHSLKSLGRLIGARRLAVLAESVEAATAASNWPLADILFEPLGGACDAAVDLLTGRYRAGEPTSGRGCVGR